MMISGDVRAAAGEEGEFFELLREFHRYWSRIDVICPRLEQARPLTLFGRVHLHPAGRFCYPDLRAKLTQPVYTARAARKLLRERRYDLMTVHEVPPFHVSLAALRLARRFDLPVVSEIHHVEGFPLAADWPSRLRRLATAVWVRRLRGRVEAIRTVNAQETPGFLIARGVPEEKIKVLYSFDLDFRVFKPASAERDVDFLFVGRLVANKGPETFVRALGLLRRRRPGVKGVIIGRGPLDGRLRALAEGEGLDRGLEIIPWVKDRRELADFYRRARALVVCSFAEGGPNVALEAMACGTPVIAPRIGVLREVLRPGVNGLISGHSPAGLAGQMERLLDEPGLAERLGAAGPEAVRPFESGAIIRRYAEGLQEVARRAGAAA